ncbi:MAG: SixA phosphatase family protein [Candidatus Hodarchaeales archaeon]
MKTLLILRHGKSSWKQRQLSDHDRPLKKRGKQDSLRIGELLQNEGLIPDIILSSDAKRAKETAELVRESCGQIDRIQYHRSLYHGYTRDYIELIVSLDDLDNIVMVVGHNPGLEELLCELTGVNEWMPTAGLAHVELEISDWIEIDYSSKGNLINLWYPRNLS